MPVDQLPQIFCCRLVTADAFLEPFQITQHGIRNRLPGVVPDHRAQFRLTVKCDAVVNRPDLPRAIDQAVTALAIRIIEQRIKELGGALGDAVSRKTSYLLAGAEAGSKLAKAQKLGTPILDEAGFEALVAENAHV